MPPYSDHIVLDRCATDIRASIALLKARILATLGTLECTDLNPRKLNAISDVFDDVQNQLLDSAINNPRQWVLTDRDYHQGRVDYFKELAASDE